MPSECGSKNFLIRTPAPANQISNIRKALMCAASSAALFLFWPTLDASASWKEKTSKNPSVSTLPGPTGIGRNTAAGENAGNTVCLHQGRSCGRVGVHTPYGRHT